MLEKATSAYAEDRKEFVIDEDAIEEVSLLKTGKGMQTGTLEKVNVIRRIDKSNLKRKDFKVISGDLKFPG